MKAFGFDPASGTDETVVTLTIPGTAGHWWPEPPQMRPGDRMGFVVSGLAFTGEVVTVHGNAREMTVTFRDVKRTPVR